MEKTPVLIPFERASVEARIGDIQSVEAKNLELERELYRLNLRQSDLSRQLGREFKKPREPQARGDIDALIAASEQERRGVVIGRIGKIREFGRKGSVQGREYDSDEGIGTEETVNYSYELSEGVFCLSSIGDYRRFGWSGSKTEEGCRSIVCVPGREFPLYSTDASPTTLDSFRRASWRQADDYTGELLKVLRWSSAVNRITGLIREKGRLVTLEGREPQFNTEIMRVLITGEFDSWSIQLGDKWNSYNAVSRDNENKNCAALRVAYENKVVDQGFNIQVVQDNIRPYIWRDTSRTITDRNYLDYVERVVEHIEESCA